MCVQQKVEEPRSNCEADEYNNTNDNLAWLGGEYVWWPENKMIQKSLSFLPTLDTLWCTVFTKLSYALNLGLVQLLLVTGRLLTTTHAKKCGFWAVSTTNPEIRTNGLFLEISAIFMVMVLIFHEIKHINRKQMIKFGIFLTSS